MESREQEPIVDDLRLIEQVQYAETRFVDQLADRSIVKEIDPYPVQPFIHVQILLVF